MTATAIVRFRERSGAVRIASLTRVLLVGLFLANVGRIPAFATGDRETAILLNDLCMAVLLAAGAVQAVQTRSLRLDKISLIALAFAAVGGASTLLSIPRFGLTLPEVAVSLSYLARWLFYFGTYVVFINALRADDAPTLWRSLETVILAVALFGIVQTFLLPNFAQIIYPDSRPRADWDPHGHRLVSTWLDPVFVGGFFAIGLLVELALVSVGERVAPWKPVVLTIAVLLSESRASLLAIFVGAIVIVLARGLSKRMMRWTLGIVVLFVTGAPLVLLYTRLFSKLTVDVSGLERVVAWMRAWHVFSEHPLIGVGFNAWGFVQRHYGYEQLAYVFSYSLDGGLIFIAAMTGLIGLALYLWMLKTVIGRSRKVWRDASAPPFERGLAIGIAAATVALVVHSLFGNSLFLPFLMETMWLLWALGFVIARQSRGYRGLSRSATVTF